MRSSDVVTPLRSQLAACHRPHVQPRTPSRNIDTRAMEGQRQNVPPVLPAKDVGNEPRHQRHQDYSVEQRGPIAFGLLSSEGALVLGSWFASESAPSFRSSPACPVTHCRCTWGARAARRVRCANANTNTMGTFWPSCARWSRRADGPGDRIGSVLHGFTGGCSGVVSDPLGHPLAGAWWNVDDTDTNSRRQAVS